MRDTRQPSRTAAFIMAVGLIMISCTPSPTNDSDESETSTSTSTDAGSAYGLPQRGESVDLDPAEFTLTIDNPYWPIEPGSQWVYREVDEEAALWRS